MLARAPALARMGVDERLSALRPCRTKARDLMHGLDRLRFVGYGSRGGSRNRGETGTGQEKKQE